MQQTRLGRLSFNSCVSWAGALIMTIRYLHVAVFAAATSCPCVPHFLTRHLAYDPFRLFVFNLRSVIEPALNPVENFLDGDSFPQDSIFVIKPKAFHLVYVAPKLSDGFQPWLVICLFHFPLKLAGARRGSASCPFYAATIGQLVIRWLVLGFFALLQERDHLFAAQVRRASVEIFPEPVRIVSVSLDWMRVAHHLPGDVFALLVGFVPGHFYDGHRTAAWSAAVARFF